jgi:uncharacterized protein (DUF1810 family)
MVYPSHHYNLEHFLEAHEGLAEGSSYSTALLEILSGLKRSHWMWYIFPQIRGLGNSTTAQKYAINTPTEAQHYLNHPILGPRLLEISNALLNLSNRSSNDIFGYTDAQKLKSSMSLFYLISDNQVFLSVINQFYKGHLCGATVEWHERHPLKG